MTKNNRRNKFYRGRYLITLYDDADRLITICDNAYEFKEFLDVPTIETAHTMLSKAFSGKIKRVNFRGERLWVHFISLSKEEQGELK